MNLQEYKRAYPQFSEWDDEVLVNRLYREEGRKAGLSFDDFSKAVGFAPEPEVAAKNTGVLSTIGEGIKSVGRAARATFNLHQGDAEDLAAIGNDAKSALSNEDARLTAFKQDIQARKERLGEDPSWLQTGLELLSAAANNPSGAGLLLAEQLPNSAAAMAGGYAGMQAGAIAGPVGAVAGGIVGMFGANYMLEGGNKAIEAAQAGQLSPDDMDRVKGEGLTKAGIITGVDVATMGLGSKLFGATQRAVDRAGARVLAEAGVDATDRAAINAAVRANPALAGAVMEAEKLAFDAATTVGQRAMRGTADIAMETFGEGLGEYVGEGVATGKWDKMEAMLEAFSSLGQSAAESVFVANRNDVAMTAQPILNAQTADEAIAIAQERVSADLTSAVTDYQSLFASAAPSGSFDQLVQNELNPVAATQLGEDQALQNYLRNTDTDTLVRDLVHADQASFERIVGGLSERAADMVLNDISSALRSATDEQLAQSPGYAAQIEVQRRRELQTEQAYSQQSEQQIAADRQKAYESGQIAEQARDQQVDLQTTISQVNEAPAAPTVMEQAMAGAQQGPSKQEQLRLEQARIRQQLQQTRDANRTQAAQLADNEAGNFSTARQARPADGETAPLSAPANNTENAKSLSRMMNGAPVADVTVQALAGKFDSIPRLMAQTAQKIGKMLGRQVVFFEGGIADGAAPQMRDDKRIFINVKQGAINPLSILGHEMMHRLRIESPKAYQTLVKAVRDSGIITDEMLADYDADYNSKDYADLTPEQADAKRAEVLAKIKSDKKTADFLLEEMLSDLNGNRFTEADFWTNVFQKIEEREGREAAKPIISRLREALVMAINRLMTAMKTLGKDGKFGADQQVLGHLGDVKAALEEAFATYMQEMKDGGSGQLSVQGAKNRGQAQRADMAGGMADAGVAGGESAGRGGVPAGVGSADPEAGAAGGEGGGGLRYSVKRDDASAHRMQIAREERELADKTKLTRDELKLVTQYAKEFGLPSRTVEMEVRRIKANFPESAGWAPLTFLRVDKNTMSKKAAEKTPLPAQAIFFEPYGYQFHLDQNGKDSNESREKRVSDIAAKLAGEITAKYMAAQNGDKNADVVMRQADWYRALRAKLRATFGGFGDFLAQLLGPTSANNPVEPNFKYGVEALKMATSGKWDNMFREVFAWKADMDSAASNLDALVNEFNDKIADMKSAANERWGIKSNKEKTLYIKEQTKKIKGEYESKINSAAEALKSASKYKGTLPVRENGKMFGMASEQIAHILGDVWGDKVHGDAPKTKNYYQNIMGRTIEATIDVWAARTLRRIANDVIGNLPRIPPVAETAVAGQVLVDNVTSGSEFGFGQDVFRKAAEDLRKSGIEQFKDATPDAVQAMVWFIEKETWATRNWTTKIGEEGSIEHEMLLAGYADREQVDAWRVAARAGKPNTETKAYLRKNGEFNEAKYAKDVAKWEEAKAIGKEMLAKIERYPDRFVAGITTEIPGDKPTNAEMAGTAREIESAIADDKIMAMRSQTSTGEFMRDIERTLDTEFVARNGYDAMPVWNKLVEIADREGQMATFLSRVLRADETVNPLVHRPGVEVYFAKPISKFDAAALMATINDADVHGLTLITEGRRTPSAMRGEEQPIVGIRMQHIPEFSMGQGGYESGMSDAKIEARVKKARQVMRRLVRQLSERSDIATVALHWYETRTHFYGNPEGNTGAGSGRGAGGSWSGQSIGEALASADRFSRNNQAKLDAKREELRAARRVSRGDSEQARFSLPRSDAGSAQRAGASAAQASAEVPGYGTAAPGAIAVQGFHYSTAERSQLDGRYYGTGTKGEEYPRVMSSRDPRIKERIYFYVDAGRGITPEQGVGSVGHTVNLNNIYDATNDTWVQAKMGRDFDSEDAWMNAFESAVIDNGFDGYVSDFGTQRAAVLLGRHSVKVQPTQATSGTVAESKPAQENAGADAVAKSRVLPGGKMSGADWKRMVPAVVPGADVSMLEDGKDYYKDDVVAAMRGAKYSLARSVESSNGLPNQADGNRTLDGAELKALRRAAANLERPRDGVFLRVTEDGKAIATGPKGTRVPDRFIRFAEENGLVFEARRDGRGRQAAGGYPMGGDITSKTEPMPAEYRESGAMYFGEGNVFYDRTGMSRFSLSRTPSASAQKEIAAIEGRLAKSPSDFVAKNLENIKRGLAGEVVRDEAGNLLAPNGRKSKLTEQQYLQVRTPEFMNWFGDWLSFHNAKNGNGVWEDDAKSVSKVVDENGEPMVVYHGSEEGGFTRMAPEKGDKHRSPMIFAAKTRDTARSYSGRGDEIDLNTGEDGDYDQQRGVYSLFLNIRNPNESHFEGANWDGQRLNGEVEVFDTETEENVYTDDGRQFMSEEEAQDLIASLGGDHTDSESRYEILSAGDHYETTNSVAEEAKRYGNDGAIIRSVIDDGGRGGVVDPDDVFVIFDSNQAKSATQNVGTFSTTNDDLRYSPERVEFDSHGAFWNKIKSGENFTSKELDDAFAIGRRGTVRKGKTIAKPIGAKLDGQVGATIPAHWEESIAGVDGGYITLASVGQWEKGRPALTFSVVPNAFAKGVDLSDSNIVEDRSVNQIRFGWIEGDKYRIDVSGVWPDTYAHKALEKTGRVENRGNGLLAPILDNEKSETRMMMQEAVRRLALFHGGVPDVYQMGRGSGKRAGSKEVRRYSPDYIEGKFSPARNILGNNLQQIWSAPDMGKVDDFIYTMQDKQVDTKRVVESIKAAVGSIADKWNPYLKEELFHGRSAKGVKDFMDFELRPLLQEMKMRGVEMAEFEKYLHNRHAEERNRQVARVNPNMPDAGSGIKTADARAYLAALDPQKRQRMDMLARRIDTITSSTLDLLEREGLETPQTIANLRAAYKYYVPLKRDMGGDGLFGMGTGQGYSVRGASSKRAMGSEKDVVDILANIAMQRERAIVRVEKNRVAQALYGLAIQNPNADFWAPVDPGKNIQQTVNMLVGLGMNPIDAQGVAKEQKQRYIDPRTGLVAERINPVLRNADNVLAVRINGEDKYLFFSETDARAQRMVHALKNLDADQLGRVMSIMGKATRYFASINTQYNPIFGIINIIRDAQGALLNLSTTPIAGKQKEVLGNTISAMRGIYADIRDHRKGRVPSSQWAQLWEEFQQVGGQTGYKDMFSRSEERAEALRGELKKIGEGKLKAAGRAIFDWLSDYNETLENATRLAAYKVAKDQGMSNDQAASLAKNLTVNFNRKGQVATQAGALYAFFNANVQGTARLVETLKGKSGKKIITGGLLLGSMQAVLLAMAGYDDDEPPAFVRERNLILPLGDHYLTLPMPLGFHVIPSMARIPTEFVLSGFKNPTKRIGEMFGLFADTFNPIGGAGISLQTIAPTVVDPFAALAENRDWTGKQIAKMDRSSTDPTPGHARAKDTASEFSKALSYWINAASGGTKYKQGLLSPTPDQLDYLIGQATGGVGREYLKAEQVVTSTATGEELPLYKVPLLGRFVGETQGQGPEGGKFYSAVTRLNEHEAEIKGLRSEGKFAEAQAYIAENPEALMVQMANAAEKRVADLRKQKRQLLERDASPERIKLVEQQITATMRRFNEQVKLRAEQ